MTYTTQQIRAFADNPSKSSRMVPIHPDTLREIADRLDAAEALIRHCRFNREVTVVQVRQWQRDADAWLEATK